MSRTALLAALAAVAVLATAEARADRDHGGQDRGGSHERIHDGEHRGMHHHGEHREMRDDGEHRDMDHADHHGHGAEHGRDHQRHEGADDDGDEGLDGDHGRGDEMRERRDERKATQADYRAEREPGQERAVDGQPQPKKPWWRFWSDD